MFSRVGLDRNAIGKYSEMLAAAAFIAEGTQIALPYGNQAKWDMLILPRGETAWKSVQVKTVPVLNDCSPYVVCYSHGRHKLPYVAGDVDLLVAVHPETGTMWIVPSDSFIGRNNVRLKDSYIWCGSVNRASLNVIRKPSDRTALFEKRSQARSELRSRLPDRKPTWASDDTWAMVTSWCSGAGYEAISGRYGISGVSVKERVARALHHIGLVMLPARYKSNKSIRRGRSVHLRRFSEPNPQLTMEFGSPSVVRIA